MASTVLYKVEPVAWNGDKVTKYQASLGISISNTRNIRISGDPKSTKESALDDLKAEVEIWDYAIKSFKTKIENL